MKLVKIGRHLINPANITNIEVDGNMTTINFIGEDRLTFWDEDINEIKRLLEDAQSEKLE